jgi:hypothetical protein
MSSSSAKDLEAILAKIRAQVAAQEIRFSQHAQQEMTEEGILLDQVLQVIAGARIIENYPDHRRGSCCLLYGVDQAGRNIHIVCTTGQSRLIIVTVYLALPPKWLTPTQRSRSS